MLLSSTIQIKAEVFDIFKEPCLFVYLTDGGVDAYPLNTIEGKYYTDGDSTYIKLLSGNVVRYHTDEYLYIDTEIPILPYMTSYKFNNKYNPNLNKDVGATITDGNINVRLNAIGKSLTASFQLSDDDAIAYIGNDLQTSKESTATTVTTAETEEEKEAVKEEKPKAKRTRKVNIKTNIVVQAHNREVSMEEAIERATVDWCKSGNDRADLKEIAVYVKPEEAGIFYVINGKATGRVDF